MHAFTSCLTGFLHVKTAPMRQESWRTASSSWGSSCGNGSACVWLMVSLLLTDDCPAGGRAGPEVRPPLGFLQPRRPPPVRAPPRQTPRADALNEGEGCVPGKCTSKTLLHILFREAVHRPQGHLYFSTGASDKVKREGRSPGSQAVGGGRRGRGRSTGSWRLRRVWVHGAGRREFLGCKAAGCGEEWGERRHGRPGARSAWGHRSDTWWASSSSPAAGVERGLPHGAWLWTPSEPQAATAIPLS